MYYYCCRNTEPYILSFLAKSHSNVAPRTGTHSGWGPCLRTRIHTFISSVVCAGCDYFTMVILCYCTVTAVLTGLEALQGTPGTEAR